MALGSRLRESTDGFAESASRLAGMAGVVFAWAPDAFWNATPVELGALVAVLTPGDGAPAGAADLARLMGEFPDG